MTLLLHVRPSRGFTLVELVVVIAIIVVLIAILLPAVSAVRNATAKSATASKIQNLQAALAAYVLEGRRHQLPPVAGDRMLHSSRGSVAAPGALDLLDGLIEWHAEDLLDAGAGVCLVDGWMRPIRYTTDTVNADGSITIARPAELPVPPQDWNAAQPANGTVVADTPPYAYVWSLGRPSRHGDAYDLDPAQVGAWIHTRSSP